MLSAYLREALDEESRRDEAQAFIKQQLGKRTWNLTRSEMDAFQGVTPPEQKDHNRIADIIAKSGGNSSNMLALATRMAKSITDVAKAMRRGRAADACGNEEMAKAGQVFYARAMQLAGGPEPEYGTTSMEKKEQPKKEAPPVPDRLVPDSVEAWELYSTVSGSKAAAKALTNLLRTTMQAMGRSLANATTVAQRAKAASAAAERMGKALDKRADYGAADTEPLYHARDSLRRYAALVLVGETDVHALDREYPEVIRAIEDKI